MAKMNRRVKDYEKIKSDKEEMFLNGLNDGTRFRPDPETYTGA